MSLRIVSQSEGLSRTKSASANSSDADVCDGVEDGVDGRGAAGRVVLTGQRAGLIEQPKLIRGCAVTLQELIILALPPNRALL